MPETRYRLAALLLYRGRHVVVLVHHGPFWVLADDARVSCRGRARVRRGVRRVGRGLLDAAHGRV